MVLQWSYRRKKLELKKQNTNKLVKQHKLTIHVDWGIKLKSYTENWIFNGRIR